MVDRSSLRTDHFHCADFHLAYYYDFVTGCHFRLAWIYEGFVKHHAKKIMLVVCLQDIVQDVG